MTDSEHDSSSDHQLSMIWLEDLAEGKPDAVQEFWSNYGDALQRVAERQIASWMRRRIDPEDVVQSACRTFFRRAQGGDFAFESKDDLWKLLLTITLNKVRMQARFHSRNRRSVSKEQALPEEPNLQPAEWDHAINQVDLDDMLQAAFANQDHERQQVVEMWLEGLTQGEIAQQLGCSERTVRRIQSKIREDLSEFIDREEQELSSAGLA